MRNLQRLLAKMRKIKHPGLGVVEEALRCSDSPEFIETLAGALAYNAKEDRKEQEREAADRLRELYSD